MTSAGRVGVFCVVLLLACVTVAAAAPQILDVCYREDLAFPEYGRFWSDSSKVEDTGTARRPLGGSLHVYLRNPGQQALSIDDVTLDGISLKQAIAYSDQRKFKRVAFAASIHFSAMPQADKNRLIALGEPIWWKTEPTAFGPGETAQAIIRLRRTPAEKALTVGIHVSGGAVLSVNVPIGEVRPRVVGAGFPTGLGQVCLYFSGAGPGRTPSRILMDGTDITEQCTIGCDPELDTSPVIGVLRSALQRGSFHCFQGIYADGTKATVGLRAFDDEFGYGLWGARPGGESDTDLAREHVRDMGVHCINVQMPIIGSAAVARFMSSEEGKRLMGDLGIRRLVDEPEKSDSRFAFYLADEPDTADFKVTGVPPNSKVGCLGQGLLKRADELRKIDPLTPNMLNVDMTFKPDNWHIYGQLPDYFAADPYYQTRLADAYWKKPETIPIYAKCAFVHAVASICNSACAPNPLHIMLNSTRRQEADRKFRWGTREEKRIEAFYALAAGAKQISYWWFLPIKPDAVGSNGCGADDPGAAALWNEIGLLGAEIRTAGPIITMSCPLAVDVKAPGNLWVRCLAAGTDTLLILCVNDDYTNDDKGTNIRAVENAKLTASVPAWLQAADVFEIDCKGTHSVKWSGVEQVSIDLGRVNVTRMIVVTSDRGLRERLQRLYDSRFQACVQKLIR